MHAAGVHRFKTNDRFKINDGIKCRFFPRRQNERQTRINAGSRIYVSVYAVIRGDSDLADARGYYREHAAVTITTREYNMRHVSNSRVGAVVLVLNSAVSSTRRVCIPTHSWFAHHTLRRHRRTIYTVISLYDVVQVRVVRKSKNSFTRNSRKIPWTLLNSKNALPHPYP